MCARGCLFEYTTSIPPRPMPDCASGRSARVGTLSKAASSSSEFIKLPTARARGRYGPVPCVHTRLSNGRGGNGKQDGITTHLTGLPHGIWPRPWSIRHVVFVLVNSAPPLPTTASCFNDRIPNSPSRGGGRYLLTGSTFQYRHLPWALIWPATTDRLRLDATNIVRCVDPPCTP